MPLLPLTSEGKNQAVVEEMIVALCEGEKQKQSDLLSLAYALSSLLFRSQDEQQWLKWRFGMLDDLLEESWALQEILQRGVKQGIEQGVKQGIEQGVQQGVQQGMKQGMKQGIEQGVQQGIEQGVQQGMKQGVEQGLQQGVQQGRQEALLLSRHTILALVEHHAPTLLPLTRMKVDHITDLADLQNLILQISLASDESEIRTYLE